MARFIAYIEGQRGEASRLGSADSGVRAQAQGWHVGAKIVGVDVDGQDEFRIYATGGSSGWSDHRYIGTIKLDEDDHPIFETEFDDDEIDDETEDEEANS